MPLKLDPTIPLLLSSNAWPLALQIVDANDPTLILGLAQYDSYEDHQLADRLERSIYYRFNGQRFKLVAYEIVKNSTAQIDENDT